MPAILLQVFGQDIALNCAASEQKRLEDLAAALNARLAGFAGDPDAMRALVLTSLALLDETQATAAALARARGELDRLTDMIVDARAEPAKPEPADEQRGRTPALRIVSGAA